MLHHVEEMSYTNYCGKKKLDKPKLFFVPATPKSIQCAKREHTQRGVDEVV
jgi:hypothetical protein